MSMSTGIDWPGIGAALAAPFPPESVEWRPQGKTGPGKRVQLLPYVDARDVQERLDAVVGVGAWTFALEPLVVDAGELRVARGRLSLHGVSKDDIGTASQWEASKGCASDALKRAAVQWGVARYLYALPVVWVTLDGDGQVPSAMLERLRSGLTRRNVLLSASA
ncbi:MAG TPA: Rad52/Rad22 family DNA repair protein [Ktedonobacterales bacterium]